MVIGTRTGSRGHDTWRRSGIKPPQTLNSTHRASLVVRNLGILVSPILFGAAALKCIVFLTPEQKFRIYNHSPRVLDLHYDLLNAFDVLSDQVEHRGDRERVADYNAWVKKGLIAQ